MLRYIYRFFNPKTTEDASKNKMYLSIAYGFLSWNCFMYIFYKIVEDQLPKDPEEYKTALINKLAHGQNIQKIRIEGLTIVENDHTDSEPPKAEEKVEEQLEI